MKSVEDVRQFVRRNALAGVLDDDFDEPPCLAGALLDVHPDFAVLGGELERVREQVDEDFLQLVGFEIEE